jgi:hypothetical protein
MAFGDPGMKITTEVTDSLGLSYGFKQQGIPVAIIPFIEFWKIKMDE